MTDRIFQFITMTVWGLIILQLSSNGKLAYYIHPRYFLFTTVAAVVILIVGIVGIAYFSFIAYKQYQFKFDIQSFRNLDIKFILFVLGLLVMDVFVSVGLGLILISVLSPGRSQFIKDLTSGKRPIYLIWVLVMIIALAVPPATLSSRSASQRSTTSNALTTEESTAVSQFVRDKTTYGIAEWVAEFGKNPEVEDYIGEQVSIDGFIHTSELGTDYFNISKFVVRCCVVDASPVGIPVIFPDWRVSHTESDWVNVKGEFIVEEISGKSQILINALEITPISVPNTPYIY